MASGSKPEDAKSAKRYNDILSIIDKRLVPDEGAKKARGEVFTPLKLVREMILGLRKSALEKGHIEVWGFDEDADTFCDDDEKDRIGGIPLSVLRDPTKKWLDPANGIGNFPVVVFYILDYHLCKYGPHEFRDDKNKTKRRTHIVENMLYMIELNKGNVNASRKIFQKLAPGVSANICCADTLQMTDIKLKKVFGVDRFNIVMGNPPFNEGGTKTTGTKGFYVRFIQYAFNALAKNGCLVFIHPPNYHRIDKDKSDKDPKKNIIVKQLFNSNNLLFLRIINNTKDYFDVQISIDYYILEKAPNMKQAVILDEDNILTDNIDISMFDIVPNFGFRIIKKLNLLHKKHGGFVAAVGRDSSHDQRRIIKGDDYKIIHYINEDGMRVFLSGKEHEYQTTKKIIVNGLGVPYVLIDADGKYGVSEGPYYILNPSKKETIFVSSNLFQYLCYAFRIQGNKNDMFLFDIVPDLNKLKFDNEKTMITALNLNEDDIKEIQKYKIPVFKDIEKIEIPGEGKTKQTRSKKSVKGGNITRRLSRK